MTILKVMVDDDQADELKKMLNGLDIVRSIEEEHNDNVTENSLLQRMEDILYAVKGKELFKDITGPVEWQRNIRKEWERDL
jgi:hypothetical protein